MVEELVVFLVFLFTTFIGILIYQIFMIQQLFTVMKLNQAALETILKKKDEPQPKAMPKALRAQLSASSGDVILSKLVDHNWDAKSEFWVARHGRCVHLDRSCHFLAQKEIWGYHVCSHCQQKRND